ncbi:MAG: hypothetical protein AMXMBFR84_28260 [Candidatus Hydrogenedentota bacterium]
MNYLLPKSDCPYCGAAMRTIVMECDQCHVEVRGQFRETQFQRLAADDLHFLEKYLLAQFSIKALAEESGLGYTAIRSRLDRIIEAYGLLHRKEQERKAVLDRLQRGEMSLDDAARQLENVSHSHLDPKKG